MCVWRRRERRKRSKVKERASEIIQESTEGERAREAHVSV